MRQVLPYSSVDIKFSSPWSRRTLKLACSTNSTPSPNNVTHFRRSQFFFRDNLLYNRRSYRHKVFGELRDALPYPNVTIHLYQS